LYFKGEQEFENLDQTILNTISRGDVAKLKEIIELVDLKRLPLSGGLNAYVESQSLN